MVRRGLKEHVLVVTGGHGQAGRDGRNDGVVARSTWPGQGDKRAVTLVQLPDMDGEAQRG